MWSVVKKKRFPCKICSCVRYLFSPPCNVKPCTPVLYKSFTLNHLQHKECFFPSECSLRVIQSFHFISEFITNTCSVWMDASNTTVELHMELKYTVALWQKPLAGACGIENVLLHHIFCFSWITCMADYGVNAHVWLIFSVVPRSLHCGTLHERWTVLLRGFAPHLNLQSNHEQSAEPLSSPMVQSAAKVMLNNRFSLH